MVLLLAPIFSQADPVSVEEVCKQVSCREATKVSLAVDSEKHWEGTFPKSPFVLNEELVNIIPGETLYLTGVVSEDKLTKLTATTEKPAEGEVVTISFHQEVGDKNDHIMILRIHNPYEKPLQYNAGALALGESRTFKTSTCPILPGISTHESWPYPILRLVLNDFHFIGQDSKELLECR